jgi:hypothetical protein
VKIIALGIVNTKFTDLLIDNLIANTVTLSKKPVCVCSKDLDFCISAYPYKKKKG